MTTAEDVLRENLNLKVLQEAAQGCKGCDLDKNAAPAAELERVGAEGDCDILRIRSASS